MRHTRLWSKSFKEINCIQYLNVNLKIILKRYGKCVCVCVCVCVSGIMWFMIGTMGALLETRLWTVTFHKIRLFSTNLATVNLSRRTLPHLVTLQPRSALPRNDTFCAPRKLLTFCPNLLPQFLTSRLASICTRQAIWAGSQATES